MKLRVTGIQRVRLAGVALLVFSLVPGCGRPPDEAWLRFLGFKQGDKTISVFEDQLRGKSTATVDVAFENRSLFVGQNGGTGILVRHARVDYRMSGFSPPAAEHDLYLYLRPPESKAGASAVTGTLTGFPLAPAALKQWLIATRAFDSAVDTPVVALTARVTFSGETDEGGTIQIVGSIGVALTNTGATP